LLNLAFNINFESVKFGTIRKYLMKTALLLNITKGVFLYPFLSDDESIRLMEEAFRQAAKHLEGRESSNRLDGCQKRSSSRQVACERSEARRVPGATSQRS